MIPPNSVIHVDTFTSMKKICSYQGWTEPLEKFNQFSCFSCPLEMIVVIVSLQDMQCEDFAYMSMLQATSHHLLMLRKLVDPVGIGQQRMSLTLLISGMAPTLIFLINLYLGYQVLKKQHP